MGRGEEGQTADVEVWWQMEGKERRYWLGARQNQGLGLLSRWGVHLKDCPKESVRQGERPKIGEGCHSGGLRGGDRARWWRRRTQVAGAGFDRWGTQIRVLAQPQRADL